MSSEDTLCLTNYESDLVFYDAVISWHRRTYGNIAIRATRIEYEQELGSETNAPVPLTEPTYKSSGRSAVEKQAARPQGAWQDISSIGREDLVASFTRYTSVVRVSRHESSPPRRR